MEKLKPGTVIEAEDLDGYAMPFIVNNLRKGYGFNCSIFVAGRKDVRFVTLGFPFVSRLRGPANRNGDYKRLDEVQVKVRRKIQAGYLDNTFFDVWVNGIVEHNDGEKIIVFCGSKTEVVTLSNIRMKHGSRMHQKCYDACMEFLLCWRLLGLNKDVGKLIARDIWVSRDHREWDVIN